jgi:hypothetical protein
VRVPPRKQRKNPEGQRQEPQYEDVGIEQHAGMIESATATLGLSFGFGQRTNLHILLARFAITARISI